MQIKRYFITGLLIWIPLGITLWVLGVLIGLMDQSLLLLPDALHPRSWLGFHIPGLGVILTLLVVMLTGVFAANVLGQQMLVYWEGVLARIPIVKSIYYGVKKVSDTLFSKSGQAFRKALLVQYPREGIWTIAFLTGKPGGDIVNHLSGDYVSVFVPTTPNPTSGFVLMLPRSDVIELDMTVDEAIRYVISMGVVAPEIKEQDLGLRIEDRGVKTVPDSDRKDSPALP
ncbi:MAG: DUF502 domain-containing protein [Burkholderiales bacterium]